MWYDLERELEPNMIQFSGHFDGRVITPDERVDIPLNTPLRVTIEAPTSSVSSAVEWNHLLELAKACAIEGPADLAERHDHYAHGKARE
jgi:hypothetical protein